MKNQVFNIYLNSQLMETYSGLKAVYLHIKHFHGSQVVDPLPSYETITRRFYSGERFTLALEGGTNLIIQKKKVNKKPIFEIQNTRVNDNRG